METLEQREFSSKLSIRLSGVFIQNVCSDIFTVNFEQISHIVPVFPLANFEQVYLGWLLDML